MPITILDYVKSQVGEKLLYFADDFYSNGVEMLGGCEQCHATIAAYNAYPSKTGYWRCADCIGDSGFDTVAQFERHKTEMTDSAIGWLLQLTLRQLQADGMDFDAALAQANAESEPDELDDSTLVNCPSCGSWDNVREIQDGTFECYDCEVGWTTL